MPHPIQRDPSSIRAFFERHGLMGEPADLRAISRGEKIGPRLVGRIQEHLAGTNGRISDQGKGVVFVFPLTGAAAHFEFFRGVLDVLAPKSSARLLATPRSKVLDQLGDRTSPDFEKQLKRLLMEKPRRVLMIDLVGKGGTFRNISKNLKRACEQAGLTCPQLDSDSRLFDEVTEHFRSFGIAPGIFSRKWWNKSASGLWTAYLGIGPEKRSQFAKERLYFYRLGRVYARNYITKQE